MRQDVFVRVVSVAALCCVIAGCSSDSDSDGDEDATPVGSCGDGTCNGTEDCTTCQMDCGACGDGIRISGRLDGATASLRSALSPSDDPFAPAAASTAGEVIDNIIAISTDGQFIEATLGEDGSFTLMLDRNRIYLVVLLEGTTIVALYKTDPATDMDAFPTSEDSTDIDLGTVVIVDGEATGTITSTEVLSALGLSEETAITFGSLDAALLRFANLDVDGNGILDFKESKYFDLKLGLFFLTTTTVDALVGTWSNKEDSAFFSLSATFSGCPTGRFVA